MDPLSIMLALASLGCGVGIGLNWNRVSREFVIEETIMYMIRNDYAKGYKDENGDWEISKYYK